MQRPLTKSRFKLAIECPTKLHYAKPENGYRNRNDGNEFLQALADGGHQVGALAKFRYHPDPYGAQITVETLDKAEALRQTQEKLAQPGRVVIAEAALEYGSYFVRVDILVKEGQRIEVIEVKSKSADNADVQSRFKSPEWRPYLYDIAFQTVVAESVFPDFEVVPKLLLVNSQGTCDVDGLHQFFRIVPDAERRTVAVKLSPTFDAAALGNLNVLREESVKDLVDALKTKSVEVQGVTSPHNQGLHAFMQWAATLQESENAFFGGVSKACKSCEFRADHGDAARSGVHECWQKAISQGMLAGNGGPADRRIPLSVDLWGGGAGAVSMAGKVLGAGRAFVFDVQPDDVRPTKVTPALGFNAFERRMAQVEAFRGGPALVLREPRLAEMDEWHWPLHMIDFETSTAALPFFAGMSPYETLAFQFSHHVLERDAEGRVRVHHAHQWISTDAATFPTVHFVRALRAALMPDGTLHGTVFRYHNHENTVLRGLRRALVNSEEPDRQALIEFIDLITKPGDAEAKLGVQPGPKAMVDLHRLVQEGYYSKVAGGSISLKYMLPAILHDARNVASLFSTPGFFCSDAVSSLNFRPQDAHVWLQAACGNDPYKTLPPIFSGNAPLNEMLVRLAGEDEETAINQGGLAMTAWNYTQFAELSEGERQSIRDALLRYCELDTLAMVMLVLGLFELRGLPVQLASASYESSASVCESCAGSGWGGSPGGPRPICARCGGSGRRPGHSHTASI